MVGTEALVGQMVFWYVWFSKAAEEFGFGTFWLYKDKVYSRAQKPILR
jgi:hypothetical protein